jgi:hypothetical protein
MNIKALVILPLVLLIVAITNNAHAQDNVSFWDWVSQYDYGYGIEYYTVRGSFYSDDGTSTPQKSPFGLDYVSVGTIYGFYFPFMKLDKDLSWGIQPNFSGSSGLSFAQGQFMASLSIPINLMIKYGTDAEYYGKKHFGVGAGLGYRVTGALMTFTDGAGFLGFYHNPIAIVELNVKAGKLGLLKARFMTDLVGPSIEAPLGEDRVDEFAGTFDLNFYGLYLTVNKNF